MAQVLHRHLHFQIMSLNVFASSDWIILSLKDRRLSTLLSAPLSTHCIVDLYMLAKAGML
jgi:hypothetical protein